jgi:hypothetical protein
MMNNHSWNFQILILMLVIVLLEAFVFAKFKPWVHVAFWVVGGFVFTYYFSR